MWPSITPSGGMGTYSLEHVKHVAIGSGSLLHDVIQEVGYFSNVTPYMHPIIKIVSTDANKTTFTMFADTVRLPSGLWPSDAADTNMVLAPLLDGQIILRWKSSGAIVDTTKLYVERIWDKSGNTFYRYDSTLSKYWLNADGVGTSFTSRSVVGSFSKGDSAHTIGSATEKNGLHVFGGAYIEGGLIVNKIIADTLGINADVDSVMHALTGFIGTLPENYQIHIQPTSSTIGHLYVTKRTDSWCVKSTADETTRVTFDWELVRINR